MYRMLTIHAVYQLTSLATSLTVNVVLTIRKMFSLVLSILV